MTSKIILFLVLLALIASGSFTLAKEAPTHLCKFENALLPCNHLKRRAHEEMGTEFEFRPTKWTPLWPNFQIFGGLKPLSDGDVRVGHSDSEAQPFDSLRPNIETTPLAEPGFDNSFVDEDLARYSTWVDRHFSRVLALTAVDHVFRGEEVFRLWQKAPEAGIICANTPPPFFPESADRQCVFAREIIWHSKVDRKIEYCMFEEFSESGIRSSPTCTIVASERNGKRSIFSARYTSTNFAGGASEGEYTCFLPSISFAEMKSFVEAFVRKLIGKSSKYFLGKEENDVSYKAEGINIPNEDEKFFLRNYIFGSLRKEDEAQKMPAMFFMNVNVTVSAQASENIIDYREPNQAMTNRLRNRFEEHLKERVHAMSRRGHCDNDYPW